MKRRDFLLATACIPFPRPNGDRPTARAYFTQKLDYLTKPLNMTFEGDSITAGTNATSTMDFPNQMSGILKEMTMHNLATGGATLAPDPGDSTNNYITYWPRESSVDATLVTGALNVLSVWAGTNDMKKLSGSPVNATPASTFALYSDYIKRRLTAGWTVMYWTVLPRSVAPETPATFENDRQAFNGLVRAASFDSPNTILVDIAADQRMGDFGDSDRPKFYEQAVAPYSGGVHPTDLGYFIIASLAARRLLEGPCM